MRLVNSILKYIFGFLYYLRKIFKSKYIIILVFITLFEVIINIGRLWPDSSTYIHLSNFFLGKGNFLDDIEVPSPRIAVLMRPMIPLIAFPLIPVTGPQLAYGIVNSILWIGGVLISYEIGKILINKKLGFLYALFYATSIPLLAYGASVLTDVSGYFFIGLALLLVLRISRSNVKSVNKLFWFLILALGSLFNPSAFFGFLFFASFCFRRTCKILKFIGSFIIFVTAISLISAYFGILDEIMSFIVFIVKDRLTFHRPGPPLLDALLWTFSASAPISGFLEYGLNLETDIINLFSTIFFAVILIVGAFHIPKKKVLLSYLPFLIAYNWFAHANIDRYLFILWPCIIPILVYGFYLFLEHLSNAINYSIKTRFKTFTFHIDPTLWVGIYILLRAVYNTIAIIHFHGAFPLFF